MSKWLITAVALVVAGCSGLQGAGDLASAVPVVGATVVVQPGEGVKCDWSSKPRVVSCHALSQPDKEPVTDVDGASKETPPVPPGGD